KWLHIRDVWDFVADAVEIVQGQVDTCFIGNRQQVQHGVGGTTKCHHDGNSIFKRFLGQNIASSNALLKHVDDSLASSTGVIVATTVIRRWRSRTGQRHTQGLAY